MTVAIFGEDALDHYPVSNVKKPSSFADLNPSQQETIMRTSWARYFAERRQDAATIHEPISLPE